MYKGDKSLADMLRAMTPAERIEFWRQEQVRKRAAGEAYHTTLYAEAAGPRENEIIATVED